MSYLSSPHQTSCEMYIFQQFCSTQVFEVLWFLLLDSLRILHVSEVSVVLLETTTDDVNLSFSSRDFEVLRQLKAETSLLNFRGISFSSKSHVDVPSSLVSRLEHLKYLIENSNPSSEGLRLCRDYLRCQLSTQLPWISKLLQKIVKNVSTHFLTRQEALSTSGLWSS